MSRAAEPCHVALAVVGRRGRWLVDRRRAGDALDGLWEFPGGRIHIGESAKAAAARECLEEVSLHVAPCALLPTVTHRDARGVVVLHPVLCRSRRGRAVPGDPKVGTVRWVGLDELRSLPMPPANASIVAELVRRFGRP